MAAARSTPRSLRSAPRSVQLLGETPRAAEPVALGDRVEGSGLVVDVGGRREDGVEQREAGGDAGHHVRPQHDRPLGIGLLDELADDRAVVEHHRLVVTGQRPVDGQLEQPDLATHRGEDRLAAHAGLRRDGVDRRAREATLDEQRGPRLDDRPTRGACLPLAQR